LRIPCGAAPHGNLCANCDQLPACQHIGSHRQTCARTARSKRAGIPHHFTRDNRSRACVHQGFTHGLDEISFLSPLRGTFSGTVAALNPANQPQRKTPMSQQPPPAKQPSNHLVFAILTTLFCCLPLGIVSIVKASQVSGLWAQANYAGAQAASDSARKWAMWSAILGIAAIAIYGILIAAGVVNMDIDTSTA
jgi:hypothetical protein